MVQHTDERQVDVVVVGGGLAGLAAATTAAREAPGARVVVLDSRSPGGRARSDVRDGFVLNQGPHAVYRDGPGAAVLARLGARFEGVAPSKRVYGTVGDQIVRLPTTAGSLLRSPLLGAAGKAKLGRLLTGLRRTRTAALAPLSAGEWVRSLCLPDEAAGLLCTLTRVATYAADLDAISADAAVRQLQMAAGGGVIYVHDGWQSLVDGLVEAAGRSGALVRGGERVTGVEPDGGSGWQVSTPAGTWTAGAVVVAAGGPEAAAALVPGAAIAASGTDATAACLDLGLRRPPERRVIFALDRPIYLSTHAPGARLAPEGASLVQLMRYGARSSAEDRAELRDFARAAGIGEDDVLVERFLHRLVVNHAQPAPGAGLAGRPPVAVAGRAGLFLAGDWVGPVGLLADAALSSGAEAGRAAAASVTTSGDGDLARRARASGEAA